MKNLVEYAAETGAEFEIYSCSEEFKGVKIENSELRELTSDMHSGVSLRLIKGGISGFAYTKNLNDPRELVQNALTSLKGGVEAGFSFPEPGKLKKLRACSEKAERITAAMLLEECGKMRDFLAKRTKGQINASASAGASSYHLVNSKGTDLAWDESSMTACSGLVSEGGDELYGFATGVDFTSLAESKMAAVAELFEAGRKEVRPKSGRHNVLFMPDAIHTLLWRVQSGASGQSLYQRTTPLAGKEGEKIFSEILTLRNNPLNDAIPGARAVDDEGVACVDFPVVEKGVFKGFYYDLNYAAKMGVKPTGHGFRRMPLWGGGDVVTLRPQPTLTHLYFDKGAKTFIELLKEMGTGIVVFGALGAHSGNIPNGDFSIGLAPGFYVENGNISGKAKSTMISGNIYDMMKRAVAAGCENDPAFANNPPVLFEGVDVAC
ncbi:MAG: metallopeptidase TldD-related protein [Elusimicrobiales bacterium]|jgi:PmbA protein